MGRKNLPAHAVPVPRTAEMPSLKNLWPVWGALTACVWIAFSPVLGNGFVDWDDRFGSLKTLGSGGWEQIRFAFTSFVGGVYQPLGWLLQSLTYVGCGLDPQGYHLVGLLFHVVNVALLHLLCVTLVARALPEAVARLGGALGWLCGIPVALYAIHPLRVEMVDWASCQAYLLSASFSLLAALAYLRAHPPGGNLRRPWMIGSSVLVVLAVLSKGSAVVLPFVFLILDTYPLGRRGSGLKPSWLTMRSLLVEKGAILVFCLAFTGVAIVAKHSRTPEVTAQPLPVARVAQASFGACFYLAKTVWPFGITAFYPRPEGGDFGTPFFGSCVAGVVAALAAAFSLRRRWPWLLAALLAYLVMASPYLGLMRVGIMLASDHYGDVPVMPWVVLGCAGLCKLAQRRWPRPALLGAGGGALAAACGLMALCSAQCRVWGTSERLWAQALEQAPWSSEVHRHLGASLSDAGQLERGIAELREALRIRPHYFEAACDLGVALDRRGETDAAIAYLREAGKLQPEDVRVYLNLSAALARRGHLDEAVALCRRGIELEPDFPNLHLNLGLALLQRRKVDEAISELTRAVELRPWYAEAYAALGQAFVLQGRQDEAVIQYRKALRLKPDDSASRINLGLALARQGRSTEAISELQEAIRHDRRNPEAHHVLAAILVASGRIAEATSEFQEVLRLRPDHPVARRFMAMVKGPGM